MIVRAMTLVAGAASGAVRRLAEPLSFWGGYDPVTGLVIDRWHPDHGVSCVGQILVMTASRGSSSGSSVLAEALRAGVGPLGIILCEHDAIVTVGAMVAAELYGLACPVVVVDRTDWEAVSDARVASIVAQSDGAHISLDPARGPTA